MKLNTTKKMAGAEVVVAAAVLLGFLLAKDGSYSGTYTETPDGRAGKVLLKPVQPDIVPGNYDSEKGQMFVQPVDTGSFTFSISANECEIDGTAKLNGRKARFNRHIKGFPVHISFDFYKPGACRVETNAYSLEAQKLGVVYKISKYCEEPDFSGDYKLLRTGEQPASDKNYSKNVYCVGMSDAEKADRLDKKLGVTLAAPGEGSAVFVYTEKPGPSDHGVMGGVCGARLDAYRKTVSGELIRTGRWQDLSLGFEYDLRFGEQIKFAPRHILLKFNTEDEKEGWKQNCYVLDSSAAVVAQDGDCWSANAWGQLDGQDLLWEIGERISVKTPDLKTVWSVEGVCGDHARFSPEGRYAICPAGKDRASAVIYGLDGKYRREVKLPVTADEYTGKRLIGLTDEPQLVFRDGDGVYKDGLEGNSELKLVLPKYPGWTLRPWRCGKLAQDYYTFCYKSDSREEELPSDPEIRDYPEIKLHFATFATEESLDGGRSWRRIEFKPGK